MKKKLLPFLMFIAISIISNTVSAQVLDTAVTTKKDVKTGFSFGAIPALAYDTDLGFLYGAIVNIYHYGDGSNYPNYNHSLYLEWSRTTKGSGKNIIEYDNRTLIPGGRMKLEMSYLTEQALDFYGFNGYQTNFNSKYVTPDNPDYISRLYYRYERKLLRLKADFQGKLKGEHIRWLAGFSFYNTKIGSVDISALNKGKKGNDLLPDTASLYDKYVEWGVIPAGQKNGGKTSLLKAGVVFDTRDNEASPQKGIWSEVLLISAPGFLGNKYAYTKISLTHRQYISLYPKKLVFAYRLNYQGVIGGDIPFYMMPFYFRSKDVKDGIGGSKTLRGILRNRLVGDGAVLGNMELRYRFLNTKVLNQNFSITLSTFMDAARIVQFHKFDTTGVTASYGKTREQNIKDMTYHDEGFHVSYGAGLHFAVNNNFIIAVDYGMAGNPQDGNKGLYIGLNYIF